jgi:Tfp pilus assembly protein PilN
MTQVNLLPADVKERQRVRRTTALVVAGVAGAVGVLFFLFVLQAARLSQASDDLAAQQRVNAGLQARIAELQPFRDLQERVAARQALVAEATAGRVAWSGVLHDLSMVIPGKMWLTGMTATLTPPVATGSTGGADAAAPAGPALIGNIQFTGTAFDKPTLAKWLTRLEKVTGWVNPWISSATTSADSLEVQFTGTVDLSVEATTDGRAS